MPRESSFAFGPREGLVPHHAGSQKDPAAETRSSAPSASQPQHPQSTAGQRSSSGIRTGSSSKSGNGSSKSRRRTHVASPIDVRTAGGAAAADAETEAANA